MKTVNNNVIQLSTKFVKANCALPESISVQSATPEVNQAIADLRDLWSATDGLVRSSRDSLYEFLGVTYEFAEGLGADSALVIDLRLSVRTLYDGDKEKNAVKKKSVAELLLAASMGIEAASLRSKYKRILTNACAAEVPPDRESFKVWLRGTGGIVDALKVTAGALKPNDTSVLKKPRAVESIMSDLIGQYAQMPKEQRTFAGNHKGFTVVLYYTKPGTTEAAKIAELADPSVVERAISDVSKTAAALTSIDMAA